MKQIKMGQFAGHYRIVATKLDGSQRVLADWFENLILDTGLNRMGTGGVFGWCQVGSGNTAPAVSDTALQSRVAGTNTLQSTASGSAASAPWYGWVRHVWRFGVGAAAGNLSEVGVGWATTGSLFSRALIKDLVGDPTTITVLSDEVLDVTYEIRLYAPTVDQVVDVVIGGVTYSTTVRAAVANGTQWYPANLQNWGSTPSGGTYPAPAAYTSNIGTITQGPSGTAGAAQSVSVAAYANNSYERVFDAFFNLDYGNLVGGIKSMFITTGNNWAGAFQCQFSANIPKDATKVLHFKYAISWARYTP